MTIFQGREWHTFYGRHGQRGICLRRESKSPVSVVGIKGKPERPGPGGQCTQVGRWGLLRGVVRILLSSWGDVSQGSTWKREDTQDILFTKRSSRGKLMCENGRSFRTFSSMGIMRGWWSPQHSQQLAAHKWANFGWYQG